MLTAARTFWFLWVALLFLKLLVAARLPLFGDEAWYWLESAHPAWAYSDLPAGTAWLIRLGTWVAGNTWLGVRWPFIVLGMWVPWLVVRFAARWFGAAVGWRAGVLALLLPLLGGLGFLALPDTPLTLAAMLCLSAAARLRERVDAPALAFLALGLVIGALSHYRFALLILAGAAGLLADARGRAALRDVRTWGVLALGALAWWPLLQWNLQHANAGFDFQLRERHPWALHTGGFDFILGQLVIVGPLLAALIAGALRHAWRRWQARDAGPWALVCMTAALPLAIYIALSFVADRERVSFHWLLQAYLPLLAVAPIVLASWSRTWRTRLYASTGALLACMFGFVWIAATPSLRAQLADSRWYPDNFAGWREIASDLRANPPSPDAPLLADNFMLGAQLGFALQAPQIAILDHPLNHKHGRSAQLALWNAVPPPTALGAQRWTFVMEDTAVAMKRRLARYHLLCETFGLLPPPDVLQIDHGRKRFLRFDLQGKRDGACVTPALAWIDTPALGATLGREFDVFGWAFKDGAGVARVEITLDSVPVAEARYGSPRANVAPFWHDSTDPGHPNVGFEARVDASQASAGTHWLGLRIHGRDGSLEAWPEQRVNFD